jgi:hypothetical protein
MGCGAFSEPKVAVAHNSKATQQQKMRDAELIRLWAEQVRF